MILRRLADGIRKQDWDTVLVEILIVVVGIFIGLQADDWNKARQDRALEQEYLERVLIDLEQAAFAYKKMEELAEERGGYVQYLAEALTNEVVVRENPTLFIKAVDQAAYTFFPVSFDDTYEEIKSGGQLYLIRDIEVKKTLARYYSLSESRNQWAEQQRNIQAKYYDGTQTVLTFGQSNVEFSQSGKTFSLEEAIEAKERFLKIKNIESWLARLEGMQGFIKSLAIAAQRENEAAQTIIRNYLGQRDEEPVE